MKNSLRQVGGAPYSLFVDGLSKGCRGEEAIYIAGEWVSEREASVCESLCGAAAKPSANGVLGPS